MPGPGDGQTAPNVCAHPAHPTDNPTDTGQDPTMIVSLNWLRRLLEFEATPEEIAHALTMAGYPVVAAERFPAGPGRDVDDVSLDVEITSNRPDLQSHLGIALELAGLLSPELSGTGGADAVRVPPVPPLPNGDDEIEVAVEAPDLCPLYTARVVRGVTVGPSPPWVVALLEAAGQRAVNNVVDVTNLVLLETGHPIHAFDLARLTGGRLVARRAAGEEMTAIDGSRLRLADDVLAIADGGAPVALAGVMGGQESEVTESTVDLALEVALFDRLAVRRASRRHQLRSESSFRFERFVDPVTTEYVSNRAAALFVEVCGASAVGPICSAGPLAADGPAAAGHSARIELRTARVERVLGVEVTRDEIVRVLSSLGLNEVAHASGASGATVWDVPSRRPDLNEEIDLIEEIARRIGTDRIPVAMDIPVRPLTSEPLRAAGLRLRDALVAAGLRECCTEPFVGDDPADVALFRDVPALRVRNPMRADDDRMRRSLLGPLLRVVRGNRDRGVAAVRFFEVAPVYLRGEANDGAEGPARLPVDASTDTVELMLASAILTGGYAEARGIVEDVLDALRVPGEVAWSLGAPQPLARGRSATVTLDGALLGFVGELSPGTMRAFGLEQTTAAFELRADVLARTAVLLRRYDPISRYPVVERDLAFVLDESIRWGDVVGTVRDGAGVLLEDVRPFDLYRGAQVGEGRKSLALRMHLRAPDRTLTGPEVDDVVHRVVGLVAERHGGELRG